jgi:hypothetical protein
MDMPKAIITTPKSWPWRLSIQLWRTAGKAGARAAGVDAMGVEGEESAVEVVMAIPIINRG